MEKLTFMVGLSTLLFSCNFAYEEKITENHYLIATDVGEDMRLSFHSSEEIIYGTIIPSTVYSIGVNDDYIIAKQNPQENFIMDKMTTQFWILPLKKEMNWKTKNGLIGPLDSSQFENSKRELGIINLDFSKTFDDLN